MSEIKEAAREAKRLYHREWRRKNPDKVREIQRRYWIRKAKKLLAERGNDFGDLTDDEVNRDG